MTTDSLAGELRAWAEDRGTTAPPLRLDHIALLDRAADALESLSSRCEELEAAWNNNAIHLNEQLLEWKTKAERYKRTLQGYAEGECMCLHCTHPARAVLGSQ